MFCLPLTHSTSALKCQFINIWKGQDGDKKKELRSHIGVFQSVFGEQSHDRENVVSETT